MFYGDYPHLPDVPVEQKDITYPYDNPELRRNFGEPVCIYIQYFEFDFVLLKVLNYCNFFYVL